VKPPLWVIIVIDVLEIGCADPLRKQLAMSDQVTEHSIQGIGIVQVETGGSLVKFDLIGALGQKIRCRASYDKMQTILFALHAGMQLATEEMAKRPGFRLQDYAPRLQCKRHAFGLVWGPGSETQVCLNIETALDLSISLMLPANEAENMATGLLKMAAKARNTKAPKLL
jgi:hypothetical protein